MNASAWTRPVRTALPAIARRPSTPWICRRCLETQADANASLSPSTITEEPIARSSLSDATTRMLRRPLPQIHIPVQHLQHVDPSKLPRKELEQFHSVKTHKKIVGAVVSTGLMDRTVKVRVAGQKWNKQIKKYFRDDKTHLVHDPNNSLVTGDVVELHRLRVSSKVEHVVAKIISPFGKPINERPPVPTPEERLAKYKEKRFAKLERRELRVKAADGDAEAIEKLQLMGLDPGKGVAPGKSKEQVLKDTPNVHLGSKGQILPEGVLPGGQHVKGGANVRAHAAEVKVEGLEEKTQENLAEARQLEEEAEQQQKQQEQEQLEQDQKSTPEIENASRLK